MRFVVGLTGGIGSGKSVVASAFAALGVEIADADVLAHRLSARGQPGYGAVRREFPDIGLLSDGEIDRARLRQRVFADAAARGRLEAALHPLIGAAAKREIEAWRGPYGIVVVPLLLERGKLAAAVDRILVVDCLEAQQISRVVGRSGMTPGEVRAIMATQIGRDARLAAADDVIDNSGPPDAIPTQVADLDRRYRALAGTGAPVGRVPAP
ncbi:MAG TPA: dephospho-CoA kinase [Casimicrobiaceae bacterium]|jgi:dephospho-CoA kinase